MTERASVTVGVVVCSGAPEILRVPGHDAATDPVSAEARARALLRAVDDLYAEDPPGSGLMGNGEPHDPTWPAVAWCDSVAATAEEVGLLERFGAAAVRGAYRAGAIGAAHEWLELPDGEGRWIVDPTRPQFGPGLDRVLGPGHPDQGFYR